MHETQYSEEKERAHTTRHINPYKELALALLQENPHHEIQTKSYTEKILSMHAYF